MKLGRYLRGKDELTPDEIFKIRLACLRHCQIPFTWKGDLATIRIGESKIVLHGKHVNGIWRDEMSGYDGNCFMDLIDYCEFKLQYKKLLGVGGAFSEN